MIMIMFKLKINTYNYLENDMRQQVTVNFLKEYASEKTKRKSLSIEKKYMWREALKYLTGLDERLTKHEILVTKYKEKQYETK